MTAWDWATVTISSIVIVINLAILYSRRQRRAAQRKWLRECRPHGWE